MPCPQTIAVIGAGISGLACARLLHDSGVQVRVFERGPRIGGRCATRRVTIDGISLQWDYGAQFAAPSDPGFAQWLNVCGEAWSGFRVGVPGMDALPAALANGLDIRTRSKVVAAWHGQGGWNLSIAAAGPPDMLPAPPVTEGPFDAVAVALPAPLAARLLPATLAAAIGTVAIAPVWTCMLALPAPARGPATAHAQDGPLDWVFRDSDKPGRQADMTCWSVQTGPGWSAAHRDRSTAEVSAIVARAFSAALGMPEPIYAEAHCWPHALVQAPLGTGCVFDPAARIGACGDWCLGARMEDAWLSGRALGAALLA